MQSVSFWPRYLYLTGQANPGPGAPGDARAGASDESTQQLELPHLQSGGEDAQRDRLHPQSGIGTNYWGNVETHVTFISWKHILSDVIKKELILIENVHNQQRHVVVVCILSLNNKCTCKPLQRWDMMFSSCPVPGFLQALWGHRSVWGL